MQFSKLLSFVAVAMLGAVVFAGLATTPAAAQASNVQVVFFTQPGCTACDPALTIVQSAVAKYGVTLKVYDSTDPIEGKDMAAAYAVKVTPTTIVSGYKSARFEGSITQAQIESAIIAAIGAPIANAGTDQTAIVRSTVTLDGSASSGDTPTYAWTLIEKPCGSKAQLTDRTTVKPTLKPDKEGTYIIQLIVTDKHGLQSRDQVNVIVAANPTSMHPIVIKYKPGTTYTIKAKQFNYQNVYYTADVGTPKHSEKVKDGTIQSSISASPTQHGYQSVQTGVTVKLDLNGADLTTIAHKPCKITWYLSYDFAAKGSGYVRGYTVATNGIAIWREERVGPGGPSTARGTTVVPWTGMITNSPVGIFGGDDLTANPVALTMSGVGPDAGQAAAKLVCTKIVIEFPAS